jgi:hypothetical protein
MVPRKEAGMDYDRFDQRWLGWMLFAVLIASLAAVLWWYGSLEDDSQKIVDDGVTSQEWFEEQYQKIVGADHLLTELAARWNASPTDEIAKSSFYDVKDHCIQMVAAYNTETMRVPRDRWEDKQLPYEITEDSDSRTDCKESK